MLLKNATYILIDLIFKQAEKILVKKTGESTSLTRNEI